MGLETNINEIPEYNFFIVNLNHDKQIIIDHSDPNTKQNNFDKLLQVLL